MPKTSASTALTAPAVDSKLLDGAVDFSRPALDRMLTDCRAGKIDLVAVWKLDRLGRSLQNLLVILDDLRTCGVDFVSLRDAGIDTTSAAGRLMLQMIGAFAEFEKALIVERVQAGVNRARAAGKHCGRPRRAFDPRAAQALLAQGHAERQVAAMLGMPRSTLRRKLAEAATIPTSANESSLIQLSGGAA